MNVLITGGSHTGALNLGHKRILSEKKLDTKFSIVPLGGGITLAGRFFEVRDNQIDIIDPRYRRNLAQIPPANFSCDAIGFCTVLYSRPIWYYKDWSKYAVSQVPGDRIPVSRAMLSRLIHDDAKNVIEFLDALKILGLNPFVIEGPRPFRHNREIVTVGKSEVIIIDNSYRELVSQILHEKNIPIVHLPKYTYDEDGFMLESYRSERSDDKTHANGEFGRLMLEEIVDFVQRSRVT